jgi:hypothetical protein
MKSVRAHLIFALIGAILAGIIGVLFAPDLFWGLLIGGALTGGAISVARAVLGSDE